MAVQDKFVNPLIAAGKKAADYLASGGQLLTLVFNFEQDAADSDLSVYRLGRLSANAVPVECEIYADASIDGTDYDLGLYKPNVGGAEIDKNLFLDGADLSAGAAITAPVNGLTNLGGADPIASFGKNLWELLGLTAPARQDFDLVLTANVAGGAAGTISGYFHYILG